MAEDRQILNEYTDHPLVNPALPKRKKTVSRIYFGIVGFFMFVLLLLCAIALGSFGEFQRQLSGFYKLPLLQGDKCMLFATVNEDNIIRYNSYSPCIFIFWGLVSGIILSFTLFVYSIVMAVIGSKVLSFLRIVELIICFFGCLGFFAFSITITAGLNKTCAGFPRVVCSNSYLRNSEGRELRFYYPIAAARNCSWIINAILLVFTVMNFILTILFIKKKIRSRQMAVNVNADVYTAEPPLPGQMDPPPYSDEPSAPFEEDHKSPFFSQTNPYTQQEFNK